MEKKMKKWDNEKGRGEETGQGWGDRQTDKRQGETEREREREILFTYFLRRRLVSYSHHLMQSVHCAVKTTE